MTLRTICLGIVPLMAMSTYASPIVTLGTTLDTFAVLGATTVTNTGPSVINGNLGLSPGTSITGFPPGTVNGTTHQTDAFAALGQTELTTAYNAAAGAACPNVLTGQNLGGLTLTPGVYCFASSAQLTGTLTLNDLGDPNAQFIFQIGSTLTTASASSVVFSNGNEDGNIFWQVGSSATLGTTTSFAGNILALTSITLNTGATIGCGRALAQNAAVTMDSNTVSIDSGTCQSTAGGVVPEPGSGTLLGIGGLICALAAWKRSHFKLGNIRWARKGVAIALPVILVGIVASANAYGTTIDVGALLTNASFENGVGPIDPITLVGCPIGWTCGGSPSPGFTAYTVTNAQYLTGADGLSGGQIVPDGLDAGYSPTVVEGSGTLSQTSLIDSSTFQLGNTYVVHLWVGTPLINPFNDPTCANGTPPAACTAFPISTLQAYFLANGTAPSGSGGWAQDLTIPVAGQWTLDNFSYTPVAGDSAIGKTIGFELFVNSGGNDHVSNFDIASDPSDPSVPEPATFALFGVGLFGLGIIPRLRRNKP